MNHHYHDEAAETMPRAQLEDLQNRRLKATVRHAMAGNAWYRARFEAAGIDPGTFRGLEDLAKLAFAANGHDSSFLLTVFHPPVCGSLLNC